MGEKKNAKNVLIQSSKNIRFREKERVFKNKREHWLQLIRIT